MKFRSVIFLHAALLTASPAGAQESVLLTPHFFLGANTVAEAEITEMRVGDNVTSAELDFCFATIVDDSTGVLIRGNFDRVVIPLKVSGSKLEGEGITQEVKAKTSISLTRDVKEKRIAFKGTIVVAGKAYDVATEPVSPRERRDPSQENQLKIYEEPKSFHSVFPNVIAVKTRQGTLPEFVRALRGMNVVLDAVTGGTNSCFPLRSGFRFVRLIAPAEESRSIVAKLKNLKEVVSVGWSDRGYNYTTDVSFRVSILEWTANGKVNRQKVAAEFSAVFARELGGTVANSAWDTRTGELRLVIKRPSPLFKNIDLTEVIPVNLLVAAEAFENPQHLVVWVGEILAQLEDGGPEPRIGITIPQLFAGPPEGIPIELELSPIARHFKGELWNTTEGKWE